jgi:peptide-methionine (S)-S-oxide reductase
MKRFILVILLALQSCQTQSQTQRQTTPVSIPDDAAVAYFASGCFWCVEAIYESVEGVYEVISGYSGGTEKNPTYREVSYGRTSHAEAVAVYYDPKVRNFSDLVSVYYASHDPTSVNRQGPDKGSQYRSIAFYQNELEKMIIESYIDSIAEYYNAPIATEVVPFEIFYPAEDYHQDYEKNNPNDPYIRSVSIPRINRFKSLLPKFLKENNKH